MLKDRCTYQKQALDILRNRHKYVAGLLPLGKGHSLVLCDECNTPFDLRMGHKWKCYNPCIFM